MQQHQQQQQQAAQQQQQATNNSNNSSTWRQQQAHRVMPQFGLFHWIGSRIYPGFKKKDHVNPTEKPLKTSNWSFFSPENTEKRLCQKRRFCSIAYRETQKIRYFGGAVDRKFVRSRPKSGNRQKTVREIRRNCHFCKKNCFCEKVGVAGLVGTCYVGMSY
jgi:hypothetical protein